ncbi:MAG: hypothetical protein WC408_06485, partial [Candidatus Micrarchaeia archaeon]
MPVLDLDEFLKKNAQEAEKQAAAPKAPQTAQPAKPPVRSPFQNFLGNNSSGGLDSEKFESLNSFKESTETALVSIGQDFLKLNSRVNALEKSTASTAAKAEQMLSFIDRVQPDKISAELSELRMQLSSLKSAGGVAAPAVVSPDQTASIRRLETEYIELSSRFHPLEAALERVGPALEKQKDYLLKAEEVSSKLSELERKIALKSDFPAEQILSKSQFEKYAKMVDLDRQQLRSSIDSLRETVSQTSSSIDRMSSMIAAGGHAYSSLSSPQVPAANIAQIEARLDEQAKAMAEMKQNSGTAALDTYSKELEKTRAEVFANYEQVKAVEKLLTAQSNKMQAVFSEIQKNLSEYKQTSDTINSTHDAVLKDIQSLKAEHSHEIDDYRRIASELEQRVTACANAVDVLRNTPAPTPAAESSFASFSSSSGRSQLHAEGSGGDRDFFKQDLLAVRGEQKRLLSELDAIGAALTDLSKKVSTIHDSEEKVVRVESSVALLDKKLAASEANNAALFSNIANGFTKLKEQVEKAASAPSPVAGLAPRPEPTGVALAPEEILRRVYALEDHTQAIVKEDAERIAIVEKGFADLGAKLSSIQQNNAKLFTNVAKSLSSLRSNASAIPSSPAGHELKVDEEGGRITFAVPDDTTKITSALQVRLDALEKTVLATSKQPPVQAVPVESFTSLQSRFDALEKTFTDFQQNPPESHFAGSQALLLSPRLVAVERAITALDAKLRQVETISENTAISQSATAGGAVSDLETKIANIDSFKTELDEWKAKADDISTKVDSLYSAQAQFVQEVTAAMAETETQEQADAKLSTAQLEDFKITLNQLAVRSDLSASKMDAVESNVTNLVAQRFSSLETQTDKLSAEISNLEVRMGRTAEVKFLRAQQAINQQALELTAVRESLPEQIRAETSLSESRMAAVAAATDSRLSKLAFDVDV